MSENIKKPVQGKVARVPVVMQLEALECGAACLTMVLAYYQKWIPLEQVRRDCGVSRDGSNALNILKAARSYGLTAEAFRAEPQQVKENAEFPCIIHWDFNHFVVLDGFRGNKVYINDPARGKIVLSPEEFDKRFTGILIMFEPGEDFVPSGRRESTFAFAKERLKGARAAVVFTLLVSVTGAFFGVINPLMDRIFLDWMLPGGNEGLMRTFMTVLVLLFLVQVVLGILQGIYSLKLQAKMDVVGNMTYFWKLMRLPMEFFSQRMTGDLLQRQTTNASIAGTLVNTFAPLLLNTVMMVVYLTVMLRQSAALTAVGITCMLINLATSLFVSSRRVNITRVQMRDAGKLSGVTMTGIRMVETIKASGAENGYFRRWAGLHASVNSMQTEYRKLNARAGLIPAIVSMAANLVITVTGVYLTIQGRYSVGMIYAFQGYLSSFMGPVSTLISSGQMLQEMRTDMERVKDVMEYPDAIGTDTVERKSGEEAASDLHKLSGEIEIRNLTFGYSRLADPLITDFSLHVKPGSKVAFVGASGCGKSTLSKLISGLYEPWSGTILFDGKEIREIDRSVFTGSVAVVDQDIVLFEDTISDNIRMWDKSLEDYEVILAARDAWIHDDIMKREGGYNGRLTEGGNDLSGGQRQRMEIARVLAQDPTILILDEATSALDAKTEFEVMKSITDRGITCIVIAHRLSTIRDCDEILVMDRGNVIERGTHDELYGRKGLYYSLVTNA